MPVGRPKKYTTDARVCLRTRGHFALKRHSDRRAIVLWIIDNGGCATIGEINAHFGFDITETVGALVRAGWLEVSDE